MLSGSDAADACGVALRRLQPLAQRWRQARLDAGAVVTPFDAGAPRLDGGAPATAMATSAANSTISGPHRINSATSWPSMYSMATKKYPSRSPTS